MRRYVRPLSNRQFVWMPEPRILARSSLDRQVKEANPSQCIDILLSLYLLPFIEISSNVYIKVLLMLLFICIEKSFLVLDAIAFQPKVRILACSVSAHVSCKSGLSQCCFLFIIFGRFLDARNPYEINTCLL